MWDVGYEALVLEFQEPIQQENNCLTLLDLLKEIFMIKEMKAITRKKLFSINWLIKRTIYDQWNESNIVWLVFGYIYRVINVT